MTRMVSLLTLLVVLAPAQTVRFESRPPAVGARVRVASDSRWTLRGRDGGTVHTNLVRDVTVMVSGGGRASQQRVTNRTTSSLDQVSRTLSPTITWTRVR